MKENELSKPDEQGIELIKRMNKITEYLYDGETLYFDGRYYRMDGNLNPYIVPANKDGQPLSREENNFPLFQNEYWWNSLIEIAAKLSDEEYDKIKFHCASKVTLSLNKKRR